MSKLSDKKVQALKPQAKDYRVNDDNGLSCLVAANGKKFWRYRYQWLGREKMLSMGEFPATSLALARQKVLDARALLAPNIDPSADRVEKAAQAKVADANTFEAVAKVWFGKQTMADSTVTAGFLATCIRRSAPDRLGRLMRPSCWRR